MITQHTQEFCNLQTENLSISIAEAKNKKKDLAFTDSAFCLP